MHQRDGADPDDQRGELMFQLSKSAWLRITRPPYGPGEIETVDGSPRVCRGGGPIGSKVAAGRAASGWMPPPCAESFPVGPVARTDDGWGSVTERIQ